MSVNVTGRLGPSSPSRCRFSSLRQLSISRRSMTSVHSRNYYSLFAVSQAGNTRPTLRCFFYEFLIHSKSILLAEIYLHAMLSFSFCYEVNILVILNFKKVVRLSIYIIVFSIVHHGEYSNLLFIEQNYFFIHLLCFYTLFKL